MRRAPHAIPATHNSLHSDEVKHSAIFLRGRRAYMDSSDHGLDKQAKQAFTKTVDKIILTINVSISGC